MKRAHEGETTLNAVLAYARQLAQNADRAMAADPYAKPYRPSEAAAKRCYYLHLAEVKRRDLDHMDGLSPEIVEIVEQAHIAEAATAALQTLAGRARKQEREKAEDDETSKRSLARLQRRRREAERDREQSRQGLSIGQRLDRALARFSVVPSVSAVEVGWSTPSSESSGLPAYHGDSAGEAKHIALRAVREIEGLLDGHVMRDVEKAA